MGNSQKLLSRNYEETLKNCSKQLIEEDGKTVAAYMFENNKNGVIVLSCAHIWLFTVVLLKIFLSKGH